MSALLDWGQDADSYQRLWHKREDADNLMSSWVLTPVAELIITMLSDGKTNA